MSRPDIIAAYRLRGLVHREDFGEALAQRVRSLVAAIERGLRERVFQHARADRMSLRLVGVEQLVR